MLKNNTNNNIFKLLATKIKRAKTIVLLTHVSPDGDALGSALALKGILSSFPDIEIIDIVIIGNVPSVYKFLPGHSEIIDPENTNIKKHYDLAIAVDCATKDRLASTDSIFNRSITTVNIDHHESNPGYADINIIDPKASATGEIIFALMKHLKITPDKNIATNLYAAILTDTGGFKFGNTTDKTLNICSELVNFGADPQYIYKQCYENKPINMFKLHATCLTNAKLHHKGKIIWTVISRELLKDLDAKDEHIDGLVEILRQVDTVEIALLFKETKDGNVKVSFRSKKYEISSLAEEYNGGGHKFAAGCTMKGYNLDSAVNIMLQKAKNLIKQTS